MPFKELTNRPIGLVTGKETIYFRGGFAKFRGCGCMGGCKYTASRRISFIVVADMSFIRDAYIYIQLYINLI